ncbi:hypothetical protein [Geminocystis herdmanii]|uniref:hypothetical protein n=1 Tax=Geminocystis herdmanii TaxID=669359 RepID=UPI000346ACA4|nr:hypothetical protein [Geminocystis herdmanii]
MTIAKDLKEKSIPDNIPECEKWLWENPEALNLVLTGLKEAKQEKGEYLGDFSQYAEIEILETINYKKYSCSA